MAISNLSIVPIAIAVFSVVFSFISASFYKRQCKLLSSRINKLENSLSASSQTAASERRGRVRAQQDLREVLARQNSNESNSTNVQSILYPMAPIGVVQSCFSTRNGTPRQPLLVPLSRACLIFNPSRVPAEALKGLSEYSHCWILYVFHLNTNLDKLWKEPSRTKIKAKVRVPSLKGCKMGVLATRSPHRPSPVGLTVAKIEAIEGNVIILSGVDLVDGTPVIDIKPYLLYSDCIPSATVPNWVKAENALAMNSVKFSVDFAASLSSCWANIEKHSLYASAEDFRRLIQEVLASDIRSLSQQTRPHESNGENMFIESEECGIDELNPYGPNGYNKIPSSSPNGITYHLILEGIDVSYSIDDDNNILVKEATLGSDAKCIKDRQCDYMTLSKKLAQR